MRLQLWSYNYDPEPTGIAPLSTVFAREMLARGHDVTVVAAHAHYPEPAWGTRLRPYAERRDGVRVLRLPLWIGRRTAGERIRQEGTYAAALSAASVLLPTPDAIVAVSPSFPALAPTIAHTRLRRVPWVLWLQDVIPDAAAVTGILEEGHLLRAARRFERLAYASADRVVVISESFRENLRAKGVPDAKVARIFNPASRPVRDSLRPESSIDPSIVLTMGNIGHTQNLAEVARAFESDPGLTERGARFIMAGDGVAADDVRAAIGTDRVQVTGILGDDALSRELERAGVALVSQRYEGVDFNVPSKLMNFMGSGLATVAAVRPDSEVARIIGESGAGWVVESPADAARVVDRALGDRAAVREREERAIAFAARQFTPARVAEQFEEILEDVVARRA